MNKKKLYNGLNDGLKKQFNDIENFINKKMKCIGGCENFDALNKLFHLFKELLESNQLFNNELSEESSGEYTDLNLHKILLKITESLNIVIKNINDTRRLLKANQVTKSNEELLQKYNSLKRNYNKLKEKCNMTINRTFSRDKGYVNRTNYTPVYSSFNETYMIKAYDEDDYLLSKNGQISDLKRIVSSQKEVIDKTHRKLSELEFQKNTEISELKAKNKALETKIEEMRLVFEDSQKKIKDFKDAAEIMDNSRKELLKENNIIKKQSEMEIQTVLAEKEAVEEKCRTLIAKLEVAEDTINKLNDALFKSNENSKSLKQNKSVITNLEFDRNKAHSLNQVLQSTIDDLKSQIRSISKENIDLIIENGKLQEKSKDLLLLNDLQSQNRSLSKNFDMLSQQVCELQREKTELNQTIFHLEQQHSNNELSNSQLKEQLTNDKSKICSLQEQVEVLYNNNTLLEERRETDKQTISDLKNKVHEYKSKMSKVNDMLLTIEELERTQKLYKKNISSLKKENDELQLKVETLNELKTKVSELEELRDNDKRTISDLRNRVSLMEREIEANNRLKIANEALEKSSLNDKEIISKLQLKIKEYENQQKIIDVLKGHVKDATFVINGFKRKVLSIEKQLEGQKNKEKLLKEEISKLKMINIKLRATEDNNNEKDLVSSPPVYTQISPEIYATEENELLESETIKVKSKNSNIISPINFNEINPKMLTHVTFSEIRAHSSSSSPVLDRKPAEAFFSKIELPNALLDGSPDLDIKKGIEELQQEISDLKHDVDTF